ncbi:MAG: HU family DNA-binding protein, partial [Muribaculaceae bacterium]|nr:HU family DNA-binding protein [Muribaculaceae bacterium]
MNNTITLPQLITRLAKTTDTDSNTARLFLRAFFDAIEKNLAAGESVNIKGIGTFRWSDDAVFGAPGGVVFVPDSIIKEEINRPFAMFSPVELADTLTEADLEPESPETTPDTAPETSPEPEAVPQDAPSPQAPTAEEEHDTDSPA